MKQELQLTNNTLADIIRFLKEGYIICIYCDNLRCYYYSTPKCIKINDEKLIYINVKLIPSLLEEDEWHWYIKSEGFVEYETTYVLPTNEENIYHFAIT